MLVIRGIGIGCAMMPAMAAAYATLTHAQVPRATSALNVLQRVGGSIGTALLAVVLQHQISTRSWRGRRAAGRRRRCSACPRTSAQRVAEPLASAFANTFWWAVASTVLALVPAIVLARTERRARAQPAPAPAAVVESRRAA